MSQIRAVVPKLLIA